MVIDPLVCIDCGLCLPECPVDAIVSKIETDPEYTRINADLAPRFEKNPPASVRPPNDPPRKATNKLK